MKRFIAFPAFTLLIAFFSITGAAQVPMNWTRDEINPGEDFTLAPDDAFFTEGMKSLHMQLNSGAVPYLVSDVFYITPGAEYEFSVDVFDHDTAGQVKIYADFYDTYGFDIFGQPPVFSQDSAEWQTVTWQGTIPMQAVVGYILIKFYNQPDLYHFTKQAEVWIDNVQFRQADGINIVASGGFESWAVGVDEKGVDNESLTVYPNPARDFVNIELPGNSEGISIIDMTGKEVIEKKSVGKSHVHIDISNWTKGIYIVRSVQYNGMGVTFKLLVF